MNGKSIADAILGGSSSSRSREAEGPDEDEADDEESAEDIALGAWADLMLEALEAKDRKGLIDAGRALVTMIRDGE